MINLNDYFTEEELELASKELEYIEKHPEEYTSYDLDDLKEALLDDASSIRYYEHYAKSKIFLFCVMKEYFYC